MTETITPTIAIIKPERIPGFDMTFVKDKYGDYTSDFRASLTLKIGTVAKEVGFKINTVYHDSEYTDGVRVKDSYTEYIPGLNDYAKPFDQYEKIGVKIDVSEFIEMYKECLISAKADQASITQEKHDKAYANSWIHSAAHTLENAIPGVVVEKSPKAATPQQQYFDVKLEYKGHTVTINKEDNKYAMRGSIVPGYGPKLYGELVTCLKKFVKFVDDKIELTTSTQTREEKEKVERHAKAKNYSELFGVPVKVFSEYKWNIDHRGRTNGTGYNKYTFKVELKPPVTDGETVVKSGEYLNISEKYGNDKADIKTYFVGGLPALPVEKIKIILSTLLSE